MCNTVSDADEDIARRNGVKIIKLKYCWIRDQQIAAICCATGKRIRVGSELWVLDELKRYKIPIIGG